MFTTTVLSTTVKEWVNCEDYDGGCEECASRPDCGFCTFDMKCRNIWEDDLCRHGFHVADGFWCDSEMDCPRRWNAFWRLNRWRLIGCATAILLIAIFLLITIISLKKTRRRHQQVNQRLNAAAAEAAATNANGAARENQGRQGRGSASRRGVHEADGAASALPRGMSARWMPRWAAHYWPGMAHHQNQPMVLPVYVYDPQAAQIGIAQHAAYAPQVPQAVPVTSPQFQSPMMAQQIAPGAAVGLPMTPHAVVPVAPGTPTTLPAASPTPPITAEVHVHLNNLPPMKLPDAVEMTPPTQVSPIVMNFAGGEMRSATPDSAHRATSPRSPRRGLSPAFGRDEYRSPLKRGEVTDDTYNRLKEDLDDERRRNEELRQRVAWLDRRRRDAEENHTFIGGKRLD